MDNLASAYGFRLITYIKKNALGVRGDKIKTFTVAQQSLATISHSSL